MDKRAHGVVLVAHISLERGEILLNPIDLTITQARVVLTAVKTMSK